MYYFNGELEQHEYIHKYSGTTQKHFQFFFFLCKRVSRIYTVVNKHF